MRKKPFRYHYNVEVAYEYATEKGLKIHELTYEEVVQFKLEPLSFNRNCFCLSKEGTCYHCNKITSYLDRKHGVYVCSMDCIHSLDERYMQEEDFKREKNWD